MRESALEGPLEDGLAQASCSMACLTEAPLEVVLLGEQTFHFKAHARLFGASPSLPSSLTGQR